HDDDVFGEHHLAHAPEAVHDFEGLHGIGFADAGEDEIVKDPFGGQGEIDQFGEIHFQDGEEKLDAGRADVEVLHGRNADNRGGVDGVAAARDGGQMEGGVLVRSEEHT